MKNRLGKIEEKPPPCTPEGQSVRQTLNQNIAYRILVWQQMYSRGNFVLKASH